MTAMAQTRINPPADWTAFERASTVLWQGILGDRQLHRYGRSGQAQYGLDLLGYRNVDPAHPVGVQCKCKGPGERVTEAELRAEFGKAIVHLPELAEYVLTTTAPDDRSISDVAISITAEQAGIGRRVVVRVWGWETIQTEIQRHEDALLAFDPTFSAFGARTNERLAEIAGNQEQHHALAIEGLGELKGLAAQVSVIGAAVAALGMQDATRQAARAVEAHIDAEIDGYRDQNLNEGRPKTAIARLEALWSRLPPECSPRLRFRVRALIGHGHLRLGNREGAATELLAASEFAADDPKALANKVLALTVLRRFPEAIEIGTTCLARDPTDETIAGYVLQAASLAGEIDPIARVPESLRTTDAVKRHLLAHARCRGDAIGWRGMARDARRHRPDDDLYVQMAAEADLSDAIDAFDGGAWTLAPALRDALKSAADDLRRLWSKVAAGEEAATEESLSVCHNAAAAALGSGDAAGAARLVREGLSLGPDNAPLLLKAAAVALETNDDAWAEAVLPKLGGVGHDLLVKMQLAAHLGRIELLADLSMDDLATLPDGDRPSAEVLVEVARCHRSAPSRDEAVGLVRRLREGPGSASIRAMALVSRLAEDQGLAEEAEESYEAAMAMVGDGTHPADRLTLAAMSRRRGDLVAVVQLLDGRLGDRADAGSRHHLAIAYAYAQPPLEGGTAYFRSLPDEMRRTDAMVDLEGAMHFNRGDPAAAEERFRELVARHPLEIDPLLKVAQCLLRLGRRDAIRPLLEPGDRRNLRGTASECMTFAQLLLMAGLRDQAIDMGYRTLRSNREDPDVNARWVGLAFAVGLGRYAEATTCAVVDTWVETRSETGESRAYLIEEGSDQASNGAVSPTHPFAVSVLGHGVGHEFVPDVPFGPPVSWRVTAVLHGYIHAFQDVSENFAARFPDHRGFWRFSMRDDDIGPILDEVRRIGERRDTIFERHAEGILPMKALAQTPGGAISFAATLATTGRDVPTCTGLGAERALALSAIRRGRRRGAVLDTLAAWTVLDLDALDVLCALFPRLLVARSTIDELRAMREDLVDTPWEGGVASYLDGRFRFEERTEQGRLRTLDVMARRLAALESSCEIVPAHAPAALDRHVHAVLLALGAGTMDAALASREHRMLHLTEDMVSRELGRTLLHVEGAWLQTAFMAALTAGIVSRERYARLLVGLAVRRHGYVSVDGVTLALAARDLDPGFRDGVAALARYVGTEQADLGSHLSVVLETIRRLWGAGENDLAAKRASGMIMEALARHPTLEARALVDLLRKRTPGCPGFRAYLADWARGHFVA